MNLAHLLFEDTRDSAEVLVHDGDRFATRLEAQQCADQIARSLAEVGVRRGDSVAVTLTDGIDVTAALFGTWRTGAVYVPLNPRLSDDEIAHVLDSVRPAAVISLEGDARRFETTTTSTITVKGHALHIAAVRSMGDERHAQDESVAIISFTSGTTGKPKPVLLLHDGVLKLLDGVLNSLRSSSTASATSDHQSASADVGKPRVVNLVPVSLSLWAGLYNLLFGMRTGALVVTMDRFEPSEFVKLVREFSIRSTVLPPAAMAMLADDASICDLAPLRYVRSITAPLSPLQARRFHDKFGIGILNGYGQTEIGGEIVGWTAADLRAHPDKLGSVGLPHAGVELRLVGDDGRTLSGADAIGELWVRTPALSGGYADGRDLSDRLSADKFFRTGDLARVDGDGFVWIEGRVSDMINRGGLKVFPADVEEVLRLSPDVVDVAVVGVPDDRLGEVPWAFVVGDPLVDPVALEELSRRHLAPYKIPVHFEPIAALPRNDVGKVLKRDLVARASDLA